MGDGLGVRLEREIREQPEVWERLARGEAAVRLAEAIEGDVVLLGSGSSLFAAQLGALALRRRGLHAHALAATEAHADHMAYQGCVAVAISQSGRSTDVLKALDALHPSRTIALTNTPASPLGERATLTIDVGAGSEVAIPATKSVSCTVAILLSAASLISAETGRGRAVLADTADTIRQWLNGPQIPELIQVADVLASRRSLIVLGTDYGAPIAREAALKFKESAYIHAEGFEAGEFRHGSAAMVDASVAVIGIMDDDAVEIVGRALRELEKTGAQRLVIGSRTIEGVPRLGPMVDDAYDTLAWLVTIQMLALHIARARGVNSDAPRGLRKAVISE